VIAFLPLVSSLAGLLLAQAPGDGWALAQAPPREVWTLYWDLFQTTEVWVRLEPADPGGKPPLAALILQALFPGREAKGPPAKLVVRAQSFPLTVVSGEALGFPIALVAEDREALLRFAARVLSGEEAGPARPLKAGDRGDQ
jgi:hypothetical protein